MSKIIKTADPTELAYIGDAVYEVYIRKHVLKHSKGSMNNKNKRTVLFVRAETQAAVVRKMIKDEFLTDAEIALVKRGRNHTNTSHPRGASPMDYKWATGFEALIGYLDKAADKERMAEVIARTINLVDEGLVKDNKKRLADKE